MTIDYSLCKVVVIEYELNGNTLKTHKYEHAFINVIMIKNDFDWSLLLHNV